MATASAPKKSNFIEPENLVMVRGFRNRPYRVRPLAADGQVVLVTGDGVRTPWHIRFLACSA